jgi:hypothetical protein
MMRIQKIDHYCEKYITKLINLFISHGISAQELKIKYKILYRGVSPEFTLKSISEEHGFISTTPNIKIAKKYAGINGKIIIFLTKNLCNNNKYLIVDNQVIFLPGFLTINKLYSNNYLEYNYISNNEIINKYHSFSEFNIQNFKTIDNFNIIIWYRAIKNKNVEILGNKFDENIGTLKYDTLKYNFDDIFSFIALYNCHIKKFETLHYGISEELYHNLFDQSRVQEVKDLIINNYEFSESESEYFV